MGKTGKIYEFINEIIGHWNCHVNPYSSSIITLHKGERTYEGRRVTIFFYLPLLHSVIEVHNDNKETKFIIGPIRSFQLWWRVRKTYLADHEKKEEEKFEEFFEI